MADFGLCWRQINAIWYLRLQVITTDQAQFWSRLNFHTLLFYCRIMFCFLSFRGIKFCWFFRVFSMFAGRLTMNLGTCKFYKLFWPVKGKKTSKHIRKNNIWRHNWIAIKPHFMFTRKNIKIFPAKFFGYDISFSNEYFCLLSLCCTSSFFYGYDFLCFFKIT